jgi:hypothetical protein
VGRTQALVGRLADVADDHVEHHARIGARRRRLIEEFPPKRGGFFVDTLVPAWDTCENTDLRGAFQI